MNIEKAMILEWAKKTHYLQDLVETLEKINARILKLKLAEAKESATEEETEKISRIIEDVKDEKKLAKK